MTIRSVMLGSALLISCARVFAHERARLPLMTEKPGMERILKRMLQSLPRQDSWRTPVGVAIVIGVGVALVLGCLLHAPLPAVRQSSSAYFHSVSIVLPLIAAFWILERIVPAGPVKSL